MPVNNPPGARTRKFFVPAVGGKDTTTPTPNLILNTGSYGWITIDGEDCIVLGFFTCPEDYASGLTVTPVVVAAANGDCYSTGLYSYGTDGEPNAGASTVVAAAAITLAVGDREFIQPGSLSAISKGDVVTCYFEREASNVADTIGNEVWVQGWIVEYTADM